MKSNGDTFQVSKEYFDDEDNYYPACFMSFPSFADYLRVGDIEKLMNDIDNKKRIRENEDIFYNYLKKIENIIKDCSKMDFRCNKDNDVIVSFCAGFPNIDYFLLETEFKKFKNNNKRLEDKFYKIGELLHEKRINPYIS